MVDSGSLDRIAIVGMAGRFPRSRDLDAFWHNLREGIEAISSFAGDEAAPDPGTGAPYRVHARGVLEDIDLFDPAFFGMPPRVAALMDPQHRLFLECALEALENAGYNPDTFPGSVGVFAGASRSNYFLTNLSSHPELLREMGGHQIATLNDLGFLATRVSYKLNLRGPSINVQTTCSTSLVAVHLACQSLLNGECDMALAGGVSVAVPQEAAYPYQEGGIFSADGHCRAFDARATGTVPGSGLGIVVLKRLSDALADGDTLRAVILGSAVNNDGAEKIGYTAPGIQGQAAVISEALAVAGVEPESVSYVEAHGTGTKLGDPIEIAALTQAFRTKTDRKGFCAIGSVKSNIGHLDEAAGVSGLIKTVLMLEHGEIAPSLHFEQSNPEIDFAGSPFFVNEKIAEWPAGPAPRRAGVSSFGLGGTNAHLVLEEAPPATAPPAGAPPGQLLLLSAKTDTALGAATTRLAEFLEKTGSPDLADVAFTLQVGRRAYEHRRFAVCRDREDAVEVLRGWKPGRIFDGICGVEKRRVAFVFPGQGAQAVGMARGLYACEPGLRERVDRCAELLVPHLGLDLRRLLFPAPGEMEEATRALDRTAFTQPALFVIELALAGLWMDWGIEPRALLGHSIGEYVAAHLAGVFPLDEVLALVAARGRMMEDLPPGAMLAIPLPEAEVRQWATDGLSLAAVNGPQRCVLSGPIGEIESLEARLAGEGIACRRLRTSHAFHSSAMEPVQQAFCELVAKLRLAPPDIPFLSNVTGDWIRPEEATDPAYWGRHLRATVRFGDGVEKLLADPSTLLLEVGPAGRAVSVPAGQKERVVVTLGGSNSPEEERAAVLTALGRLWLAGVEVSWEGHHGGELRRRVPLPTYCFARQRCWIEPAVRPEAAGAAEEGGAGTRPIMPPVPDGAAPDVPAATPAGDPPGMRERVLERLQELLARLFGLAARDLDPHASFLELGADSLLLLQAKESIQREFGVKLSFYQLLEDCNTLSSLALYLAHEMPAETPVVAPAAAPASEAPRSGPVGTATLDRVIAQQIELNNMLLEALRGGAPSTSEQSGGKPISGVAPAIAPAPRPTASAAPPPARAMAFPFDPPADAGVLRLTPLQRQHLEGLIARYTRRTAESKRHTDSHRRHLSDNRSSVGFRLAWKELVYPIVAERSRGSRFWDLDGNEYIDLTMGFGVNLFGHSPDFVRQAVAEQLERGVQIGPQSNLAGEVASLISRVAGVERVTFCNSGTEAVMTAMRLARAVTGRHRIAYFSGSYHGTSDGTLFNSVETADGPRIRPRAPGVPPGMGSDLLILDYATPRSLQILEEKGGELAAVLVEPVQSRRPDLQPRDYLHDLRRLTRKIGAALIFDETITGFRPHPRGARGCFDIDADLVTFGKVIGGGMPIGVVTGVPAYLDAIDGGMWQFGDGSAPEVPKTFFAGTFCKHPLSMAAARAVLIRMEELGPDLQRGLNRRADDLAHELDAIFAAEGAPIRTVHFGSQFMLSFSEPRFADLFFYHLVERGVYVWEGRTCFLSTAHGDQEIESILRAVRESAVEMREGGFFDGPRPVRAAPQPAMDRTAPLTGPQRELWIETQIGADASRAYNESLTLRIRGPFDPQAMQGALQEVVDRHEALRTTFSPDGDYQRIATRRTAEIAFADLSGLGEEGREARLAAWRQAQEQDVFDLAGGPLFRVGAARLASDLHLLVITVHHLVVDAWSLGLVLDELTALYSARLSGHVCELPPPGRFGDYAERRTREAGRDLAAAEAFWRHQLAPPVPVLELPTDAVRPVVRTYAGDRVSYRLDGELLASLKRLSSSRRATPFTVFFAAFTALLHRLTGQRDLILGISAAGQSASGEELLVGFCVNFLPLRSRIAPELEFTRHLEVLRETLLRAHQHQDFPVLRLLSELGATDWSRPLVAAELNMERALSAEVAQQTRSGGLEVSAVAPATYSAKFDVEVDLVETRSGIEIGCIFNADLFRKATIERWLRHYEVLLRAIAATPGARVLSLPLLAAVERQQLLFGWNDTARRRGPSNFPELFAARCAACPEAVAVSGEGERLTYRELSRRVAGLCRRLTRAGVGPEVRVALLAERTPGYLTAVLAVLAAGGAFLPLDPRQPAARLAQVLELAKVPLVLCAEEFQDTLSTALSRLPIMESPRVMPLSGPWPEEAGELMPAPRPEGSLAYILFTSGSTGVPKGVLVEERGMLNHLWAKVEDLGLTGADVVAQNATQTFDISVWQLLAVLLAGGRVHIVSDEAAHDPHLLLAELERERITVLEVVPPLLAALLDEADGVSAGGLRSLRWLIATGETLPPGLTRRWFALCPGVPLLNAYGPTECSDDVTHHRMNEAGPESPRIPIGRGIANLRIHVVDGELAPQPIGVAGEIAVGGIGVGRGYLDDPVRTAAVFVPDPWSSAAVGARLYLTGDLGRWLPDGLLEHLGRLDHQVKIRGFRVELGEIETVLGRHPSIRQAAVVVTGGGSLAAYAVPREGQGVAAEALRRFLEERLPAYMVPASFMMLPELPVGPTGKLDRRSLPEPETADRTSEAGPRDLAEQLVAELWCEVLGLGAVDSDTDFFEAGGDSLLATRLLSRVRRSFAVDLPLRRLFEGSTVRQLAASIERERRADRAVERPLIVRRSDRDVAPLSFGQQRLWFLDRLEPGSPLYNIPAGLHLVGRLDAAALARSFGEIVRRHEVLRTSFVEVRGEPRQEIGSPRPIPLPCVDLSSLPTARRQGEAARLRAAEALLSFDLSRGPLLRAILLRFAAEEHVLLVTMHHIVSDGWSMEILVRECGAIYAGLAAERDAVLAALPFQYGDYASWQRQWLTGEVLAAEIDHWRRRLAGVPSALDLPTDRPRPTGASSRGGARTAFLAEPWEGLKGIARQHSVSLFMLLTAAFEALLFRSTGQPDFCLGTPVAGRGQIETEGMIGFFVNTLVLRAEVAGSLTFPDLLRRVREVVLEAHLHQDLPFEKLVEELEPERNLGRSPIFQVMFQADRAAPGGVELPGLSLRPLPVAVHSAKFDLNVATLDQGERLASAFVYRTDLFDGTTVERMLGHWTTLLSDLASDPERRLEDLALLTGWERQQLIFEASSTAARPEEIPLHELFARTVERHPEAIAVVDLDLRWTYAELDHRAEETAERLRELGVGPETPVALFLERSADLVAAILGVLKAGGAYVPLDPAYPKGRVDFVLRDTGAPVLVTRSELLGSLPEHDADVVLLDTLSPRARPAAAARPSRPAAGPRNAAYVIYTSGSTGAPKGVVVTHANVSRLFAATAPWFSFDERDVWTLFHSYAFDFSVWELWGALLHGGRLVIVPYLTSRSPLELGPLLERERVTVLNQTPSAFRQLVAETAALAGADLALRWVIFGGEALDPACLAPWFDRHGEERPRLVNMYGITETTVHVTWRPLAAADVGVRARSPIGIPIPDLRLFVLDAAGRFAPIGVPGEIHVGGAGLARGYLGRPELTAERFVPDPWSGERGARLYRTGDLARRRADGELEYLGRADQQIKIRGFRIEPGEIEAALLAHPAVAAAVVVPRQEAQDDQRLVAYVVPADGVLRADAAELRAFLGARLPSHMLPTSYVPIAELPLTAQGKLDRGRLSAPLPASTPPLGEPQAHRSLAEEMLAGIWRSMFQQPVGRGDDFFALGGHSLLAVRMLSRIREAFAVDLPLRDVFETPILAILAAKIEAAVLQGQGLALPPLVRVSSRQEIPLSFGQQRLWFMDRLDPGAPLYNIPMTVRLEGPLAAAALERAFGEILRRHEALRTAFAEGEQGGVQVIQPPIPFHLSRIDLAALGWAERESEVVRLAQWHAHWHFDLTQGPLLMARLLRLGPQKHVLLVTVHHIASDARSMEILVRELKSLYRAFSLGQPSPLPEPTAQYQDFSRWQRAWLQGSVLETQLAYWRRQLAGAPPLLPLPTDRPRPAVQTFRGSRQEREIPAEVWEPVEALARSEQVTPFMILLAVFQVVLRRHSGASDLVVGTPVDCRRLIETEDLIGFFVNTLPLRVDLAGNPPFRQLLERVRRVALEAFAHQDLPFERLVEELRPVRDPSYSPIVQVGFTFGRDTGPEGVDPAGLQLGLVPVRSEVAQFEVNLTAIETARGLGISWHYNTDLFDEPRIDWMGEDLERVLRVVAAEPDLELDRLDDHLAEERRRELSAREGDRKRQQGQSLRQARRRVLSAAGD
jgi:amino acid adenylation domain-containing protein